MESPGVSSPDTISMGFFFFFNYYLFFWLCWVFISVRGLSLVAASGGHSSSRCAGLSLSWPLLLRSTGSRRAGAVVVAHRPSCSAACGIFPDQGSNPCPLHRQADSQPLCHQGSHLHGLLSKPVMLYCSPLKKLFTASWHDLYAKNIICLFMQRYMQCARSSWNVSLSFIPYRPLILHPFLSIPALPWLRLLSPVSWILALTLSPVLLPYKPSLILLPG